MIPQGPLFEGADLSALATVAAELEQRRLHPGDTLLTEGAPGTEFAILVDGAMSVMRAGREVAVVGPGALIGELALLTDGRRTATATATAPSTVLTGRLAQFVALLEVPGVAEAVERLVSLRLAENVPVVSTVLPDGTEVLLRPLLPEDDEGFRTGLKELSAESLRRRFFTAGPPTRQTIEYLLHLDYVNHFAWLVLGAADPDRGLAVGRYVRDRNQPGRAEIALTVIDEFQGRGAGTLLLGALGAAASSAGIGWFTASFLVDNTSVRAVLEKAGAAVSAVGGGEAAAGLDVVGAVALLEPELAARLTEAAHDIVTAAGLALAGPAAGGP